MARKKKDRKVELDGELDFKDLDDITGDDMDFGDLEDIEDNRKPSMFGVAQELSKEAGRGFLDELVKQTAKKSIPQEYTDNYYELMDYADLAKNTFDENKSKVNKSIYKLGKEVKKVLPFQLKMLDSFLERYETNNEQARQESEEALRENSIQSNISSIFDKQLEIQKALEAKHDAERQVESKERITTNKLNLDILTSIDTNISNHTAFTLQISKEYYRKSLELQFKTYFIQADMLKTMRDHYKGFSIQFDSIVKNTSLPEFVKLNNTERIQEVVRTQAVQGTFKNVISNSKYVENVKKKLKGLVNSKVSAITDNIDGVTDQLSMVNSAGEMGGSSITVIGNILSGMLGTTLGEKLGDKISPKLKDKLKDNKALNTGANYMGMLGNSPSTLFDLLKTKANKKKDEYSDEGSPLRFMASKMYGGLSELLGVTDPGKQEFEVKGASLLNHGKPAIFDNNTHRSITEVIPMYLAKILKQNTDLTNMYKTSNKNKLKGHSDSDELAYDYTGRKLVTHSQLKSNVENSILASATSKSRLGSISNTLLSDTSYELSKNKSENAAKIKFINSKKSKKLLDDYLSKVSKDNSIEFDYKTVIEDATDESKAHPELKDLLNQNPELKELLDVLKENKPQKQTLHLDDRMKDVKRKYPISAIKELFKGASKLANSRVNNLIKDKQAEILAKAFSQFITDVGRDISISTIISGECFKYIPSSDYKDLKDNLVLLVSEVKSISNMKDIVRESSLSVLLGTVNRTLKDNFELDPSVFQTLYEYSPILGDKGNLTPDNLIERKLTKSSQDDFISLTEIKETVRAARPEVDESRTEIIESEIESKLKRFKDDVLSDIQANRGNPLQLTRSMLKHIKTATTATSNLAKKKYEEASKRMEDFGNFLNNLTEEKVNESIDKLIDKIASSIAGIDEMIKTESANRDQELKTLNEAKSAITDIVNDATTLRDIEREITRTSKYYDITIKTLEKLKSTLISKHSSIVRLRTGTSANPKDLIMRIKTELQDVLSKVRELTAEARRNEEEAAPT